MAKAELKTKATKQSADAFINSITNAETRKDCQTLVNMMKQATKAEPVMWGPAIVGFGDWHFVYESGREGDWFIMGFSPRKQNLTLYIMPGFSHFPQEMAQLGKYKTGKSCLYVKRLDDVNVNVLRRIMSESVKHMKAISAAPNAQAGARSLEKKVGKRAATKKAAPRKSVTKKKPRKKA